MKCHIYVGLSVLVCGISSLQLYSMDIFKAIESGNVQQVRRLLEQSGGADKDKQDEFG